MGGSIRWEKWDGRPKGWQAPEIVGDWLGRMGECRGQEVARGSGWKQDPGGSSEREGWGRMGGERVCGGIEPFGAGHSWWNSNNPYHPEGEGDRLLHEPGFRKKW